MVDVAFFGINRHGEMIYDWLVDRDDANVLALITDESQYDTVEGLEPELIVASGFRHIIPEDILEIPAKGAVNTHNSYLPYNRGVNANVWSIIDDHPGGVALHYMTADVDAGPIIDRRELPVRPDDTGKSFYRRQERAVFELFVDNWAAIRDGTADTTAQAPEAGTYHRKSEFGGLLKIELDVEVVVGDFIDRLRALTFPPFNNAYFEVDGHRYYVELSITPEEEASVGDEIHWNIPTYDEE